MAEQNAIRPNYYKRFGVESVEFTEQVYGTRGMIYVALCTAYYYISRIGEKDGNAPEQELGKANWWLAKAEEYKKKIRDGKEVKGVFDIDLYIAQE